MEKVYFNCKALKKVQISDSVEIIGNRAFVDDKNLFHLKIPSSVKIIEERAFASCDNLTLEVKKGSYAEHYAKNNKIIYVMINF